MNLNLSLLLSSSPVDTPKYKSSSDVTYSVTPDFSNSFQPCFAESAEKNQKKLKSLSRRVHYSLTPLNTDIRVKSGDADKKKWMAHTDCLHKLLRPSQDEKVSTICRKRLDIGGHSFSTVAVPSKGNEPQKTYGLTHYAIDARQKEVVKAAINLSSGVAVAHSSLTYDTHPTAENSLKKLINEEEIQNLFKLEKEFAHLLEAYSYTSKSGEQKRGRISEFYHSNLLKLNVASHVNRKNLESIFLNVLEGLIKMSDEGIIHGALTPENIILLAGENGYTSKITNFSSAMQQDSLPLVSKPLLHLSPEVLSSFDVEGAEKARIDYQNKKIAPLIKEVRACKSAYKKSGCNEKELSHYQQSLKNLDLEKKRFHMIYNNAFHCQLDVWSFGVLVYETLLKKPFYASLMEGKSDKELVEAIAQQMWYNLPGFQDEISKHLVAKFEGLQTPFGEAMASTMILCLNPDPCSRPEAKDVWRSLYNKLNPPIEISSSSLANSTSSPAQANSEICPEEEVNDFSDFSLSPAEDMRENGEYDPKSGLTFFEFESGTATPTPTPPPEKHIFFDCENHDDLNPEAPQAGGADSAAG